MSIIGEFKKQVEMNIHGLDSDKTLFETTMAWIIKSNAHGYTYNFSWLDRPIIQYPQDMIAMQELIWQVQPDLIIETGIAHGGSLVMSASMLALIDYKEAVNAGIVLDPKSSFRRVLGLDIEIRPHNLAAIEAHPMAHKIDMIEGDSVAPETIKRVYEYAKSYQKILICLDSNHTHNHVLAELEAYAPLTSHESYCVVFDTLIEDMPEDMFRDKPWGKKNNPKTAVREYLRRLKQEGRSDINGNPLNFEINNTMEKKLVITVAPEGYLKRL